MKKKQQLSKRTKQTLAAIDSDYRRTLLTFSQLTAVSDLYNDDLERVDCNALELLYNNHDLCMTHANELAQSCLSVTAEDICKAALNLHECDIEAIAEYTSEMSA